MVERDQIIDGTKTIRPGDVLIGLASSGFHSNGYSLVRKAVTEVGGLSYDAEIPELGRSVGEALLEPTRLYVRSVQDVLDDESLRPAIHGLAHITGGGLPDNVARILPEGCRVQIDRSSWERPPIFTWLQNLASIENDEMDRVCNMGIGFVLVVTPDAVNGVLSKLEPHNFGATVIGEVVTGSPGVELK